MHGTETCEKSKTIIKRGKIKQNEIIKKKMKKKAIVCGWCGLGAGWVRVGFEGFGGRLEAIHLAVDDRSLPPTRRTTS